MHNNLLLVNLPCYLSMRDFLEKNYNYNPSLGLLAIADYIEMFGFHVYVIDYNYTDLNVYSLMQMIKEKNITTVGITVYTENYIMSFKFMNMLKSMRKDIVIFAGGPHATLKPEEVLKNRYVDFVVTKDGEATILELLLSLEYGTALISLDQVKGLYKKECGKKIHYRHCGVITDLDLLPVINRERVNLSKFGGLVSVYTSKGCPGKCIYCSSAKISDGKYRTRSVENVYLECILIKKQVIAEFQIFFIDDTFTANKKRVIDFCSLIKAHNNEVKWGCESRVDVMTLELLDMMLDGNCCSLQFGVESGNQKVLDSLNKKLDLKHLELIICYARKYNVYIFLSFMLGHFLDTEETMKETIMFAKYLRELNSNVSYSMSINTPFPGTWQYEHAKQIGLRIIDEDYSHYNLVTPVISTNAFNKEMLLDFYKKSNF